MKRLLILIAILLFIFVGCKQPNDTVNEGKPTTGELTLVKFEFNSDQKGQFVQPGQTLNFTVIETLEDKKGQTTQNQRKEGYSIEVSNSKVARVNENQSITLLEDAISGSEIEVTLKYKDKREVKKYILRKSLEATINKDGIITNPEDYDAIVNKVRSLPADYVPNDLVKLQVPTQLKNPEINQLRKVPAGALVDLFAEAKKEGFDLIARSGYRSYNTQEALYNGNVVSKGQAHADKYSAKPGESEHQTGLSMDVTCADVDYQLSSGFGDIPEGIWLKENAHKFGFIVRYPKGKEAIVGYEYEPWHIRYLGVSLATKIYESGLTMEEYFQQQ